jgi:nucleotide-binding universal stress UspA family protein
MAKKILCAVDDTEHSKDAVAFAAQMANAMGAELTLLAVNQLTGAYSRGGVGSSYQWDDAELKRVLDNAAAAAKEARAANSKVESVRSRDVARAIVVFAEDNGIDHIVVGTAGKGGVSRLMLGSVSREVVARGHCPVTVVR